MQDIYHYQLSLSVLDSYFPDENMFEFFEVNKAVDFWNFFCST